MTCNHSNLASYRYCVVCGANLQRVTCPRCSAVCDSKHLFCHGCGENLRHASQQHEAPISNVLAKTYDLDKLLQSSSHAAGQVKIDKVTGKMTQEQIRQMLAARQKKK